MPITDDRRNHDREKDDQRNSKNVGSRLGGIEGQSLSTRHESDTVFYSNSEGRDKTGSWASLGGQATIGGIHRRLKELHEACLTVIDSQQKQLENSLHERKQLTAEIEDLYTLLGEALQDIPNKE
ncbi:MAG: hypothetical protein RMY16_08415 [Nostoc sp. DedQUE12b]|nr:hypothetical protein [Nostoc sp. DedQUE12b]MDZ8085605.1 hypothetical protein [Nostoc sp. DedQUE12b]